MHQLSRFVTTLAVLLAAAIAAAQDGAIVDRDTLSFTPGQRSYFEERSRLRGIELDLDRIIVQRISYLSDGLRVKGYLMEPATSSTAAGTGITGRSATRLPWSGWVGSRSTGMSSRRASTAATRAAKAVRNSAGPMSMTYST